MARARAATLFLLWVPLLTPSTPSSTVRYYVTPPYILPHTCCQGVGHLVADFTKQNFTHDMLPELSDNDLRELANVVRNGSKTAPLSTIFVKNLFKLNMKVKTGLIP